MATSTQSGTTLGRLRSTAANRLTSSLLGSSGKVATVGLVTACLTLAFTLWFRVSLEHQSEIASPAAREALSLNAAINESVAALRGWVAYGDPEALEQRRRAWTDGIDPAASTLERIGRQAGDAQMLESLGHLEQGLRDLRRIQWAIEDVARTPGNRPAQVEYEEHLAPLRRSILAGLRGVVERLGNRPDASDAVTLILDATRFRAAFTRTDLAVTELLDGFSEARAHAVDARLREATSLATRLSEALPRTPERDAREAIRFLLQEFTAYRMRVPAVVAVQRSEAHNVSKLLFEQEAQPVAERVQTLSADLAEAQTTARDETARGLVRASYVVIALAVLMGLLSAGSLFVSYRLRRQVEDVMGKAKALGQYVIDARLGTGGMGEVFLAHHAMLRRPTAIKLLRASSAGDLRAQERFQREVRLTSQLSHPNTIEVFDYGRTPQGLFYYAMEYLRGFTLDALVKQVGPIPPARVVHILCQACGSLEEAHRRGLLHRDVKPSNIMLTERGGEYDTVKLLDFGLAREITDGDQGGDAIAGTPMYIAPEIILSPNAGSPQTDLYALGAVGYFLLTGTSIFPSGQTLEIFERHLTEQIEFPSQRLGRELPEDLETVILSCLAKDPAERPGGAAALAALLRATDVSAWSADDARLWWEEYGEAMEGAATGASESTQRSGVEIAVETSRS